MNLNEIATRARATVETLQQSICAALETVDGTRFHEDRWERAGGGGGRTRVLAHGNVFEKAGVNTSAVWGEVPAQLAHELPGQGATFFATGISLVLHPANPHAPTTHANFRCMTRGDELWFGGGADLTPWLLYEEDARHFHGTLARACESGGPSFYRHYKRWCDGYFKLTHRDEVRGVGGIFFDWLRPGTPETRGYDLEALLAFWQRLGESFLPAYLPILERRKDTPFTAEERAWQLARRGRYAEFNLLYDRGTKFGLQTGGRTESILMSLPPLVSWEYDAPAPAPGSREARLLDVLRVPVDWVAA